MKGQDGHKAPHFFFTTDAALHASVPLIIAGELSAPKIFPYVMYSWLNADPLID